MFDRNLLVWAGQVEAVKMLLKDDGPGYEDGSLYLDHSPTPSAAAKHQLPPLSLDLTDSPLQPQQIAGKKLAINLSVSRITYDLLFNYGTYLYT